DMSCFLLGGRAWMVLAVDHENRVVRVQKAPRGKKPSWGGFIPQHLGFRLCQKMRDVLTSDDDYPFVDEKARVAINEWRDDLGALLKRTPDGLRQEPASVKWWTFAGGRINQTLKYAFERECGWKVVPDNFSLRIEGDGVSLDTVYKAISDFRTPGYWNEDRKSTRLNSSHVKI